MKIWKRLFKTLVLFLYGGFLYSMVELLWRGYTHWTMFIVGAISFILVGAINEHIPWSLGICWQMLIGGGLITVVEFFSGVIINIIFKMDVWDYSEMPGNLFGQICPQYSVLWFLISIVAIVVDDLLRTVLFNEEPPHYTIL